MKIVARMSSNQEHGGIPEAIVSFIRKHHVLTLATSDESGVWCSNCFYAYDRDNLRFIFTSSPQTHHATQMHKNNQVAASIVLETRIVGRIQGLQIRGEVKMADSNAKSIYLKRFPYAVATELHLWELKPTKLKLTDNTLGFGKKLIWEDTDVAL